MIPDGLADLITSTGALLTAVGTLVGVVVTAAKTHAELRQIRSMHANTSQQVAQVSHRLDHESRPNGGHSLKDSLDRIEVGQQSMEAAINDLSDRQRGMARDIGRLASADQRIEATAHDEHERIHRRIDQVERQTGEQG